MLRFSSGTSKAVNTQKAVAECLEKAGSGGASPDLVVIHTTLGHKFDQMLSELSAHAPGAIVAGCTGSGVIGSGWVSEAMRAMAAMAVYGEGIAAASMGGITGDNSESLARQCAEDLRDRNPNANVIMAFGPGLDVDGQALISGIESVFGEQVPVLGGLAGFSGAKPITTVFHGESALDDGLVLVAISDPDVEVVQVQHHGSLPQPDRFTITRAEGTRVDEFNGEPAWPTFMASIGMPTDTDPTDVINLIGLGLDLSEGEVRDYDNEKILRAPLLIAENGTSCYFQASLPEGTVLTSCQRDEAYMFAGVGRLRDRLQQGLGGRRPLAVFHIDCMGRGRLSNNNVAKDEIIQQIQSAVSDDPSLPWLGVYGFAEFGKLSGRNRHHNYTTALSAIVAKG